MPSLMLVLSARNWRWKLAIEMLLRILHIQRRSHNIPLIARTTWQPEEVQEEGELLFLTVVVDV